MKKKGAGSHHLKHSNRTARVKEAAAVYHFGAGASHHSPVLDLVKRFGLQQQTLSRMTGFSPRAVADWAAGKTPSMPARRVFSEMDRLLDALSRLMKPRQVGRWLKEPNTAFEGSSPAQLIERGQSDRLWRMLYHLESGEPG